MNNESLRSAKKIVQKHELTKFISNMISDDPAVRPSIREVNDFLTVEQLLFTDENKITIRDLGINDDLEASERSISNDLKRRAEVFEHCPFSTVNILSSINHLTSYEELSKAGKDKI